MNNVRRTFSSIALAAMIAGSASPLAAKTAQDCYDYVIGECSRAMDGARFYQRFALGVICTGMLAGCTGR